MTSVLVSTAPKTPATDVDPRPRRWTREEYYRMAELGWFHAQRVELIEGEIMVLSPQGPSHTYLTDHVAKLLRKSGWTSVWVRIQFPIDFGPYSDPEPDASVVAGSSADYRTAHPTSALLIVEVSDTTLVYDRGRKASLYAMRGVAEYWIVNVNEDQLEVHRDPGVDLAQPFGHGYASVTVRHRGEMVTPQAAPHLSFSVADLLG
jgi:Uma2 family endonuclease